MRLIDAKVMEKQTKESFKENPFLMGQLLRWIRKQPTIDAEPVKHGRWVYRDSLPGGGGAWWHCSECGRLEIFVEGYFHKHCPNCGAKMTEGEA